MVKKEIHPDFKECEVICTCGTKFKTESTKENLNVEICSACHPFYTGKQGTSNKRGKIEEFNKKYNIDKQE
jgi:large subunit ribosomal protein L31